MLPEIEWPLRPDGSEVPVHRRSIMSYPEGYPIFCASDYQRVTEGDSVLGRWMCGYCEKFTTDPRSPHQHSTLADCRNCGKTNRISLS